MAPANEQVSMIRSIVAVVAGVVVALALLAGIDALGHRVSVAAGGRLA
jgi:preprotein translocase subunit SecE